MKPPSLPGRWFTTQEDEGGRTQQWEAGSTSAASSTGTPSKIAGSHDASDSNSSSGSRVGSSKMGPGAVSVQRRRSRIVFVLMHRSASQLHIVGGMEYEHWTNAPGSGRIAAASTREGGGGTVPCSEPEPKPTHLQVLESCGHPIAGFAVHAFLDVAFTAGIDGSLIAYNFKSATQLWRKVSFSCSCDCIARLHNTRHDVRLFAEETRAWCDCFVSSQRRTPERGSRLDYRGHWNGHWKSVVAF
jgi:hypothetical protein